jgi:membrane protein
VVYARRTWLLLRRSVPKFYKDGCGQLAASISYYVIFTIFPLLIVTASVLGLFVTEPRLQEELINAVLNYVPLEEGDGRHQLRSAVQHISTSSTSALGVLGLLLMLWSAGNLFGAVRNSLNRVFDFRPAKSTLRQKLEDFAMAGVFAPFFVLSIAATAAVRFARRVSEGVPLVGDEASGLVIVWLVASWTVPGLVSLLAFFTLYRLVPSGRLQFGQILTGSLVATIIFESAKVGFALYVENLTNYDVVFGPLGTVAAFLSWLYFSACVMLFGAEVSATYPVVMVIKSAPRATTQDQSVMERSWSFVRHRLTRHHRRNKPTPRA